MNNEANLIADFVEAVRIQQHPEDQQSQSKELQERRKSDAAAVELEWNMH